MTVSVLFLMVEMCMGGGGGGFLRLHFYKREHLRALNWNILQLSSIIANQLDRALKGPLIVTVKMTKKTCYLPPSYNSKQKCVHHI